MSQLIRPLNESRSDYTYFDISSYNASETEQQGASFRYTEDRNSPFLDGPPEAYEMSIIRNRSSGLPKTNQFKHQPRQTKTPARKQIIAVVIMIVLLIII